MAKRAVTREDVDALLKYLPLFEKPGRKFARWPRLESHGGVMQWPHPDYDDDVEEFFALAARECWVDYEYMEKDAARMLEDDAFVARANLEQVKTMLTFCVRGERFCDGHWEGLLTGGRIIALLRRLKALREEV